MYEYQKPNNAIFLSYMLEQGRKGVSIFQGSHFQIRSKMISNPIHPILACATNTIHSWSIKIKIKVMSNTIVIHPSKVERSHSLLDAAPVDEGTGLENVQLAAKLAALLFEPDERRLAHDDAVDGRGRRRDARVRRVRVAG
jgi:hypothetical protein